MKGPVPPTACAVGAQGGVGEEYEAGETKEAKLVKDAARRW